MSWFTKLFFISSIRKINWRIERKEILFFFEIKRGLSPKSNYIATKRRRETPLKSSARI
jgi:hypothetical protein